MNLCIYIICQALLKIQMLCYPTWVNRDFTDPICYPCSKIKKYQRDSLKPEVSKTIPEVDDLKSAR